MHRRPGIGQRIGDSGTEKLAAVLVSALVLAIFGLYAHSLQKQSLWFDEGLSVIFASRPLPQLMETLIYQDLHPPLYYLLLHSWISLAGNSEWAVRLPSALAAVLLIPLAFGVVREVFGDRNGTDGAWVVAGLSASALIGTSPFFAYYAQETRMYSIAAMLSLATTWAFLRAARKGTTRWWYLFGFLLAAGLYTQYFSAFVGPAFWLYTVLLNRRLLRGTALGTALAVFLYVPWIWPAYMQLGRLLRVPDYWVSTRVDVGHFVRAIWETILPNASARLGLAVALVSILLLLRFAHQRRYQLSDRTRRSVLVFLTLLIPILLTYAAVTLAPKFATRYTIVAAAPLYICAVLLLYPLLSHRAMWARALSGTAIILAVLLSLDSMAGVVAGRQNRRDDVRGLAAYLSEYAQPDDAMLLVESAPYALEYYYRGTTPMYGLHVGNDFETAAKVLNHILKAGPRRVWLVLWHHEFADPTDMVVTELMRVGREMAVQEQFLGYELRAFDVQHDDQTVEAYPQPRTATDALFSPGVHLLGFDMYSNDPGQLHYAFYWETWKQLDRNYSLTLALQDPDGNEYLRQDQALSTDYFLPPAWPIGTPIRGRVDVTLPADLPAITYRAYLQILDPKTRRNLDLVDERGAPLGQELFIGELFLPKSAMSQTSSVIQNPLDADMGSGLRLLGFEAGGGSASSGDRLRLTLWWQRTGTPGADQPIQFRLLDSDGSPAWNTSGAVIDGYPLSQWQIGEINRAVYRMQLSPDLPSGNYELQVGSLHNWTTIRNLALAARPHRYDRPQMQHMLDLPFEQGITLLGYDLEAPVAKAGEKTVVRLYWQAQEPIPLSYKVSVQLLFPDQRIAVQDDSIPVGWTYPTAAWLAGEVITDEHTLSIRPDSEPGDYGLIVVLYDEQSLLRLHVQQADQITDHAALTTLVVAR